jgi:hypothetical protein
MVKRIKTIKFECHGVCDEECKYKDICVMCFPSNADKFAERTKMKVTMTVEDKRESRRK